MDQEAAAHTPAGAAAFRAAAEAALQAAGLHLSGGARLWAAYRRARAAAALRARLWRGSPRARAARAPLTAPPPRAPREYEAAAADAGAPERVRALWHRQLAVPLAGGEEALAAYEAWEAATGKARARAPRAQGCWLAYWLAFWPPPRRLPPCAGGRQAPRKPPPPHSTPTRPA